MEIFQRARTVRLRSHHEKYLMADEDEEHVQQERQGSPRAARWTVDLVGGVPNAIRLRSCYGRYLTASDRPFLLGLTGKKVLQTLPTHLDSSVEWVPVAEGDYFKLKSRYGNFLRANGSYPPWRNSVTHDVPHHTTWPECVLWDVEIVELLPLKLLRTPSPAPAPTAVPLPEAFSSTPTHHDSRHTSASEDDSVFSYQSSSYSPAAPIRVVEERIIHYTVADDEGKIDDSLKWRRLTFGGESIEELSELLKAVTKLDEIILCRRDVLKDNQLVPLSSHHLPTGHEILLVVMDSNSTVAKSFMKNEDT